MFIPEIKVFPTVNELVREAAERIITHAKDVIASGQLFSFVLAGGSTPKALYQLLGSDEYRSAINWSSVEIYFGDERCVPPDHKESNFLMAQTFLLSKLPIPEANVHRMKGELDPEEAAKQYGLLLKEKFADEGPDVVLLGMGEDGHTLSLFPGTAAVTETKHRVVANYAENSTTGKSWRVTMTAPFVNRSKEILVMATGAAKAKRVIEVLEGPREPQRLPIQLIEPAEGKLVWLMDVTAAGMHIDE